MQNLYLTVFVYHHFSHNFSRKTQKLEHSHSKLQINVQKIFSVLLEHVTFNKKGFNFFTRFLVLTFETRGSRNIISTF